MDLLEFGMIKASEITDQFMLDMVLGEMTFYDINYEELSELISDDVLYKYLYVCTGAQPLVIFDEDSLSVVQVSHPRFIENDIKMINSFIEKNLDSIKDNDFNCVLHMAPNYYIQLVLDIILEKGLVRDPSKERELIVTTYSSLEYVNNYYRYLHLFKKYSKYKEDSIKDLDEQQIIYRGVCTKSTDLNKAMSWTTDFKTARFFANRFNQNGIIYKTVINKDDILAYIDSRNEYEVLIDPSIILEYEEVTKKD